MALQLEVAVVYLGDLAPVPSRDWKGGDMKAREVGRGNSQPHLAGPHVS